MSRLGARSSDAAGQTWRKDWAQQLELTQPRPRGWWLPILLFWLFSFDVGAWAGYLVGIRL